MATNITRKPSVLLVDDNEAVLRVLSLILENAGFAVERAQGGPAAVEAYRTQPERFDVVLLDVQMPGQDGTQTFAALRALNPAVKAVFLSGNTGKYSDEELLALGAARVLQKPPDLAELEATLRRVIGAPPSAAMRAATRTNRRVAVRHHPTLGTVCRLDAAAAPSSHLGLVWNLSRSGLSMVLHAPLPADSAVRAELQTADHRGSLPITLQVVHVRPICTGDYYLGAQFARPLAPDELHSFLSAGPPRPKASSCGDTPSR